MPLLPLPLLGLTVAALVAAAPAQDAPGRPRYGRDVRPILADRCFRCHGPDAGTLDLMSAALSLAAIGSFFAGSVATMLIAAFAPPLAEVAFKFGPAEYFSLMTLGLVGAVVLASGSLIKAICMILLIALLIWVVTIVISFKLFWYLCSEAGCDEFGVPHGSAQTVLASCAAWVGIFIVNFMGSGGGQVLTALMSSGAGDPQLESPMESEEEAAARREAEAYATRRARAEAMLREQAELEAAMAAGEEQPPESDDAEPGDNYTVEEAPVPQLQPL